MADRSGNPVEKIVTKNDKRRQLERLMTEFIKRRYPNLSVFNKLVATNPTQQTELDDWNAWVQSCFAELLLKVQAVDAAPQTPESGWRSVNLDKETLRLSDPKLNLKNWLRAGLP